MLKSVKLRIIENKTDNGETGEYEHIGQYHRYGPYALDFLPCPLRLRHVFSGNSFLFCRFI